MLWTGRSCEDASAGYGASAKVPQVPQVHQGCVRTDLSTVRQPEVRGEISPRIKCSSLRFECNSLLYLNRGLPGSVVYDLRVLTQLWCTCGTCGTFALAP